MTATEAQSLVKYVLNSDGKTTDVLVPLAVWEALLQHYILEGPDPESIAASILRGLNNVKEGKNLS